MPRLCALKCQPMGIPMHTFPDPEKYPERFKTWVTLSGGNPESVSDCEYFQKKRLCDRHFTNNDRNRFNRLNALAVPSLHITGSEKEILHKFPNPAKDPNRFRTWIHAAGGNILMEDDEKVYKTRRVCHMHFEPQYHTWNKLLSRNSIPTLHISGRKADPDHEVLEPDPLQIPGKPSCDGDGDDDQSDVGDDVDEDKSHVDEDESDVDDDESHVDEDKSDVGVENSEIDDAGDDKSDARVENSEVDDAGDETYMYEEYLEEDEELPQEKSPVFETEKVQDVNAEQVMISAPNDEIHKDDHAQKWFRVDLKLCRACLSPRAPLLPLPELSATRGLLPASTGPRPKFLCTECANEMRAAASFIERARRAETAMSQLAQGDTVTMEDILKIDRRKHRLTSRYQYVFDENGLLQLKELLKVTNVGDNAVKDTKEEFNIKEDNAMEDYTMEDNTFQDISYSDDIKESDIKENLRVTNDNDTGENIEGKTETRKKRLMRIGNKQALAQFLVFKKDKKLTELTKIAETEQQQTGLRDKMEEYFNVTAYSTLEEQVAELQRRKDNPNYVNAPLKCEMCYQGFLDNVTYELHMHQHTEESGAFPCAVCHYRFLSTESLQQHMLRHSTKFRCKACAFESPDRNMATLHMRSHEVGTRTKRRAAPLAPRARLRQMGHATPLAPRARMRQIHATPLAPRARMRQIHATPLAPRARLRQIGHATPLAPRARMRQIVKSDVPVPREVTTEPKDFECAICEQYFKSSDSLELHLTRDHLGRARDRPRRTY